MRKKINRLPGILRNAADYMMFGKSKKGNIPRLFLSAPIAIPLIFWAATIESFSEKSRGEKGAAGYPQ